jgi:asparagine synthase (glutamine-hydrolysing)
VSGLAVAYGTPDVPRIEEMLAPVAHRGGYIAGTSVKGRVAMGQRYLRADCPRADPATAHVPVGDGPESSLRICYDGKIALASSVAANREESGAFREERSLMRLYRESGSRMFEGLDDAIFAFVISDGEKLLAARDLAGIKTLFYGREGDTLYFASEVKSLLVVTQDVHEFPPGHFMDESGRLTRFAKLPEVAPPASEKSVEETAGDIRDIIGRSLRERVTFEVPTGSLLSGGLDSSIITFLAGEAYRERHGRDARLPTFALGLGESEDITSARAMAQHVGSDHHELIVDLDDVFEALPEVIYYLESFDPSLVRSSVANFLIGKVARERGIEVLLSGEGGDEMFCGYAHMKSLPPEALFEEQMAAFGALHNNASLRLDRMNQCHSIRVVAPLISGELFSYVLTLPASYKIRAEGDARIEKWILRKAYEPFLPPQITRRTKQEFSQGSGVAALLPARVGALLEDTELDEVQAEFPFIRSKEELYYFRIFGEHFGFGLAVESVGQWIPE